MLSVSGLNCFLNTPLLPPFPLSPSATDILRQHEFLTRFKSYLDDGGIEMTSASQRHFVLQMALKCADISNPCRPWLQSKKWGEKVTEEFFQQGDFERENSLEITKLCDR